MDIRLEQKVDQPAVHALNCAAFGRPAEADLVDVLRARVSPLISLVAEERQEIVGHILFSPVTLDGFPELKLMGLGPVAAAPHRQRSGIGSQLIRNGLEQCREQGVGAVVLLGHPEYYPRFGFKRAKDYGIGCEFGPCDDSFMLAELEPNYLHGVSGTAKYHPAFNDV